MIEELVFQEEYFNEEEREGFLIESMMKRAWAAQIVVLREIDRICRRHGIQYFADWGTLLGAARHKGFIPWDDDMDIAMKRRDYKRFLKIAEEELPEGYRLHTAGKAGYPNMFARVVNSSEISFDKERMETFYGCPYVVGIDIFPLDIIPRDEEEEELQAQIMMILWGALKQLREGSEELEATLSKLHEFLNVEIDRSGDVLEQLLVLADRISQLYGEADGDEYTLTEHFFVHRDFRLKKEWYESTVDMVFENILIPVPVGYQEVLDKMYGEWRTFVKNSASHDYPFYKNQKQMVEDYLASHRNGK